MQRLAAAAMAMCLLPLALLLAPLSIHAGRGSTLTFVLRPVKKPSVKIGLAPANELRAANA